MVKISSVKLPNNKIKENSIPNLQSFSTCLYLDNPYMNKHIKLVLDNEGHDVFAPSTACLPDYRYGPSFVYNDDGSIDAWFSAPGDGSREYDWITYRHSDDGGDTWGEEKVVLSPTPETADYQSVCDPDVFYYNGYYCYSVTKKQRKDTGIRMTAAKHGPMKVLP